jgi:branched-chain amino acid transport system ATP-binding protein
MSETLLQVKNLYAGYGKSEILHDITLSLKKGDISLIVGPNGSGKSTFAKALFNLATIFSGRIIFRETDITKMSPEDKVLHGIFMVPQINNVFENLTVKENLEVAYYSTLKRRSKKDFEKNLERIYTIFPDIKSRINEKVKNLSGGQKQMVAIARALVVEPELLILDEPTSQLSPHLAKLILNKIIDIKMLGTTVLLIEQNVKMALSIADYVYVFVSGRKILEGEAEIFKTRPEMIENAFFGKV